MTLWLIGTLALIGVCALAFLLRKSRLAQSSADADSIDRLTKAGSDPTKVHAIEFLFSFPVRVAAEGASTRLRAGGYTVSVEEYATSTGCALRATRSMIPRLSELQALRSTLNDLAAREGGVYDGWNAEVVK